MQEQVYLLCAGYGCQGCSCDIQFPASNDRCKPDVGHGSLRWLSHCAELVEQCYLHVAFEEVYPFRLCVAFAVMQLSSLCYSELKMLLCWWQAWMVEYAAVPQFWFLLPDCLLGHSLTLSGLCCDCVLMLIELPARFLLETQTYFS